MDITMTDLPDSPGIYLFKDQAGTILYVGKAKRIRRRVASYYKDGLTTKTRALMAKARSIDTLVTATEKEALLLEASLIKKHKPRYNIVLRDDKQYVLFRLSVMDAYPRLTVTRKVLRDKAAYFGPYTSALAARDTWKAILHIFPLRRCKDSMFQNRVRPCLYHQMNQCLAPCVLDVDRQAYQHMVKGVEMLLSGRTRELLSTLEKEMKAASEALEYERAAMLRDQARAVRKTVEGQVAVLGNKADMDVLGMAETGAGLGLSLLFVRKGRLLDKKTFHWPDVGLEEGPEVLESFLGQYYGRYLGQGGGDEVDTGFIPDTVLLPWALDTEEAMAGLSEMLEDLKGRRVRVRTVSGTMEKKLVDMARANARQDGAKQAAPTGSLRLAKALGMAEEPVRVEGVDVSHTMGQDMRVGMVVFESGSPRKDGYRLYRLDGVEGGDDYAALAAWAERRGESGPPWPDLLVVDGGRGQLAAVERGFATVLDKVPFAMLGIAKMREEEGRIRRSHAALEDRIFVPGRKNEVPLKPGSQELLFLQRVRDAAHTFVISRHRKLRGGRTLLSELESLPGVGPSLAKVLWDAFPSLSHMAQATTDELAAIPGIGKKRAARLKQQLEALGQGSAVDAG